MENYKNQQEKNNKMTLNHIAFIMDGNRRWARERGLHPWEGHNEGVKALERIGEHIKKKGIKYMTVYALSVENILKRSKAEVLFHFKLHKKLFRQLIDTDRFMKDGIRFNVIGRVNMLPKDEQELIKQAMEKTRNNDKHVFTACIAYNGQDEIVDACREIIKEGVPAERIGRETIKQHLYTRNIPPPDLIVRTGMDPDMRLSGFLLWDSSYAEFAFTKTYWPALTEKEVDNIIKQFNARDRRKGK
jgi:undecaprenyl diphosphate synthase